MKASIYNRDLKVSITIYIYEQFKMSAFQFLNHIKILQVQFSDILSSFKVHHIPSSSELI